MRLMIVFCWCCTRVWGQVHISGKPFCERALAQPKHSHQTKENTMYIDSIHQFINILFYTYFCRRVVQYFNLITWFPHWSPGMLRYAQRRVALARASSGSGSPEDGRATGGLTSRRVVRNAETSRVTQKMEPKHHPIEKENHLNHPPPLLCSTFIFQAIPSRSWKLTSPKGK